MVSDRVMNVGLSMWNGCARRLLELSTGMGSQIRRYDTKRAASLQWEYRPRQQLQVKVRLETLFDGVLFSVSTPHSGCFRLLQFTPCSTDTVHPSAVPHMQDLLQHDTVSGHSPDCDYLGVAVHISEPQGMPPAGAG